MNGFEFSPLQFKIPVGSVLQFPYAPTDQSWLRCDGSIILRSNYPALSAQLPNVGVFTPTIRAQVSAPQYWVGGCAVGATVVMGAVTGTLIQYSTNNGVTWAAGPAVASAATTQVVYTGVNFVAACAGVVPYYSATGSGAWIASTGAGAGSNGTCFAATNGAGSVLMQNGNGQTYYSTNNGQTYASAAPTGSVIQGSAVVYAGGAGTTWLIFGNGSTAGAGMQTAAAPNGPWTAVPTLPWGSASIVSACSDGAGNVLAVLGSSSIAWMSNNSGVTWREVLLPLATGSSPIASYANGRWFVSLTSGDFACSADTYAWAYIPPNSSLSNNAGVSYSSQNYCVLSASGNVTMTEDTTKIYLPMSRRTTIGGGSSSQVVSVANWQEWIKAQP